MAVYDLTPIDVPLIETKYRSIRTKIPVPESVAIFEMLAASEPRSMSGQPPVVWHRAEGFTVHDKWGNRWIDWSSCVLVANAGHGRAEIREALKRVVDQGLVASYVFVHEQRVELCGMLKSISPDPETYRVFLLSTGSEATENAIKLAKTYALEKYGPRRKVFVSFRNAFHGRTMGAQLAGGMDGQKKWLGDRDLGFIQVPFPDGFKNADTSFGLFLAALEEKGIAPDEIAGVMTESYQGVGPDFLPVEYARRLESFCREHDIVTIFDEVQSGFGRTGKMFCYEHYGVKPDIVCCGKGISSSLPISAVIGRADIMELYPPGSMTSTHSASPLPVAAAIANLNILREENLAARAALMEGVLMPLLAEVQKTYSARLGCLHGKGLVAGIQVVKPGTRTPDPDTALRINVACMRKGVLMFAPVGIAGECLKIAPPLTIAEDALVESAQAFGEAVEEVLG
ncbi:MAG: aspartate aminotransferase family protein [Candidatus Aminicenantes bacterium]|nr:MAG: aspartate aminotransferase family protein [Candidatus Aminicenantes bacterium]